MPAQQQCLRHRELLIAGDVVVEGVTLEILESFVKKLNIVVAGWDLEPCHWMRQGFVCKP